MVQPTELHYLSANTNRKWRSELLNYHFLEWNYLYFGLNAIDFYSKGPIEIKY